MSQKTLNLYDDFLSEITSELADVFNNHMLDPEGNQCVECSTDEYLKDNQTRLMSGLYVIAKENPDMVLYLLKQLEKQFVCYQKLSTSMLENFYELFPEQTKTDCT